MAAGKDQHIHVWKPLDFLNTNNNTTHYVILVLNRPIKNDREVILSLWKRAKLRIAVDGGSNHWLKFLDGASCIQPDFITGDMDSALSEVLLHFKGQGTKVIFTPDQNDTDFTKALKVVREELDVRNQEVCGVFAVVDSSGRMDHILANINTLFKADSILRNIPVYQLSKSSLSWLLRSGSHEIHIPEDLRKNWCSLAPIGAKACVTTTGLKWNLSECVMEFGGLVSTSNTYDGSPVITVKTDSPLLWSLGLTSR